MPATILLPAATSLLALVFALALLDQWLERRGPFQLAWAIGMTGYGIAAGAEAIAGLAGWNELLYKAWYAVGIATPTWLGLGTALLLARTRFGYTFAATILLGALVMFALRASPRYAEAGPAPVLYAILALVVAIAVAVETYFQNERWPWIAAGAIAVASLAGLVGTALATVPPPGYALDPRTGVPTGELIPDHIRLLAPFLNVTGALTLVLGALFSTYVFMPKRRVLAYSLDPSQPGDVFLFNLAIAPLALAVNFGASLPGTIRALAAGRIHSRVPATILIAIGAFIPSVTDTLNRFGSTELFQLGKFLGVVFLFLGFLVSVEAFREIRVPFTRIRMGGVRAERVAPAGRPTERA